MEDFPGDRGATCRLQGPGDSDSEMKSGFKGRGELSGDGPLPTDVLLTRLS